METIIKMELPMKRVPSLKRNQFYDCLPWRVRWLGWLYTFHRGSIGEFGGSRTNHTYRLTLFRWPVLTIKRNEYHDRSDKERADEYLQKWSECEAELRGLRLIMLGDSTGADVKKLIRDSFGVDLDEGTIK